MMLGISLDYFQLFNNSHLHSTYYVSDTLLWTWNPQTTPWGKYIYYSPIYKWETWDTESLSDLSMVTGLERLSFRPMCLLCVSSTTHTHLASDTSGHQTWGSVFPTPPSTWTYHHIPGVKGLVPQDCSSPSPSISDASPKPWSSPVLLTNQL